MEKKQLIIINYLLEKMLDKMQEQQHLLCNANEIVKQMEKETSNNDPLCCITSGNIEAVWKDIIDDMETIHEIKEMIEEEGK